MTIKSDKVHILLCGYYFHGNTGDDLLMESITATLGKYGEVQVINGFDQEKIDWCDLLVIGGGSHIRATSIGPHEVAKYARKTGKKIIYYAQTIEEGHPLFKEHLALADLITVRDSASRQVVERNGFRAILSSDPVFKRKRYAIGFSFRRWVDEPAGIEENLASILDNLSKDFDIISIPYTPNDTDTENDTVFHENIIQRMHHKPERRTYAEAIEKIDLFIGMRLHALISAVNAGKKVLAIDYDTKIGRIFSDLAMEDLVISYCDINKISGLVRNKIFRVNALAQREKVNEALIAKLCADIKDEPVPQISAVMYSCNQAGYIKKAIDSVIGQTIKDWELIIIDDGSIDDTDEIVSRNGDMRIRYFNFGHNGFSFSKNIGNLLSRGKIICVADPGAISMPERFESINKEMEQTKADFIYSSLFFLKPDGEKELIASQPFTYEKLRESGYIFPPTVAYRRDVAITCQYDEDHEVSADYQMYLKAADSGYKFHYIEYPLVMQQIKDKRYSDSKSSLGISEYIKAPPMVSVIIPTCNRPEFLKEALHSVLSQTYRDFEVIVVNDGGEDVAEVIKSLEASNRVTCLTHENKRGPSAARNTGLKAAKGKYVAYLDDDDIYYPDHLYTLVSCLEKNNYSVAYTDSIQARQSLINDSYVITDKSFKYDHDFDRDRFLVCNYIHLISIVHKRNLTEEAGYFDEQLETHEDWDLCIRLSRRYDFHHVKSITAEFRMRDDITNATNTKRADFLRTLKLIHKRYMHLVPDNNILEAQKELEESLALEIAIKQIASEDLAGKIELNNRKKDFQINHLNKCIEELNNKLMDLDKDRNKAIDEIHKRDASLRELTDEILRRDELIAKYNRMIFIKFLKACKRLYQILINKNNYKLSQNKSNTP